MAAIKNQLMKYPNFSFIFNWIIKMSILLTVYNWGVKGQNVIQLTKISSAKNGSSQQGDDTKVETNDTTIETRRL
jgi:hypothetical protein